MTVKVIIFAALNYVTPIRKFHLNSHVQIVVIEGNANDLTQKHFRTVEIKTSLLRSYGEPREN